jgi:hypothetical protein
MAVNEEQLGKLQVQIEADLKKMTFDMDKLRNFVSQRAEQMERDFKSKKIRFDDTLMKKSVTDLIALRKKLQAQFEQRVKLNFDLQSISQSRDQLDAVNRALRDVGETAVKTENKAVFSFKKIAGAIGLAFGVRQLFNFGKRAVESYGEQDQAIRKLDTALNRHSKTLIDYASALQKVTIFGDEQIIEAQARIAAFTKEESKIKALTLATLDFATAKGIDLVSAADLLSKTLGSSVNALARYGIEVEGAAGSSERLESITKGIAELWGDQALDAAKTQTGQLKVMNNDLNDQEETLGGKLLPIWLFFTQALVTGAEISIQTGRNIRASYENIALGIGNLLSGQISFWDFVLGKLETAEQRAKRLGSLLMSPRANPDTNKNREVQLKSYTKIVKEIEELNERLNEENLSLEEAAEINTKIAELTKQITFGIKDSNREIDEAIKKIQTENELRALTTGLSREIMESTKAILEEMLKVVNTDEDRLKLLREIKKINEEIEAIKPPPILVEGEIEDLDFPAPTTEDRKKAIDDLNQLRISAIESEFAQREELILQEFETQKAYLEELYELQLISGQELQEALANNQKVKEKELAKLSMEKFNAGLSASQSIASALSNVFGDTRLIQTFTKVLSIVESIAAIMQSLGIIGAIFSGPVGAAAALEKGGSFLNGKVTPYNQIPKFSNGINFKVPPRYVNDSFLMRVSAGEKVNVTPKNEVTKQESFLEGINQKLDILNNNFIEATVEKPRQGAIPLFGKLEGKDIYISNKRAGKVIGRMT